MVCIDLRMLEKIIIPASVEKICNSTSLVPKQENGKCNHTADNVMLILNSILCKYVKIIEHTFLFKKSIFFFLTKNSVSIKKNKIVRTNAHDLYTKEDVI